MAWANFRNDNDLSSTVMSKSNILSSLRTSSVILKLGLGHSNQTICNNHCHF